MAEAGKADDRLPWLDAPRMSRRPPAARHARGPLLILLALFLASGLAVMAFLAGRGTVPTPAPPAVEVPLTPARPPAAIALPTPAPPAAIPAATQPAAKPVVVARRAPTRATIERRAARRATQRAIARQERWVMLHRARRRPLPAVQRYHWPAPSATPSGRVIQLGAYYNGRQTMASWQRLRRAYPYLGTLPRRVTVIPATAAHPRYYRLRIGAPTPEHARAMCNQLHRIGRGCIVV